MIPIWKTKIEKISSIPALFLELEDYTNTELRDILSCLVKEQPGLYFATSTIDDKSIFLCMFNEKLSDKIDGSTLLSVIQKELGLRGSLKGATLQGGGPKIKAKSIKKIRDWFIKATS